MSSNAKGLAGRYAGALYDLTVEAKSTDAVSADLAAVKSLVAENNDIALKILFWARDEVWRQSHYQNGDF